MSLKDLGVFKPLQEGHPAIGTKCWICNQQIARGTRTALKPYETKDQTGSFTVEAKLICATCHLRGETVTTDGGERIVDRIKDGDGSPFPVITTDGHEWGDDEITMEKKREH
jgi:hypothetical protein